MGFCLDHGGHDDSETCAVAVFSFFAKKKKKRNNGGVEGRGERSGVGLGLYRVFPWFLVFGGDGIGVS